MNGPNENANSTRSFASSSAASSTYCQHSIHHCQSSAVSSTVNGRPRVPDVWCRRTYCSSGNVKLTPRLPDPELSSSSLNVKGRLATCESDVSGPVASLSLLLRTSTC